MATRCSVQGFTYVKKKENGSSVQQDIPPNKLKSQGLEADMASTYFVFQRLSRQMLSDAKLVTRSITM